MKKYLSILLMSVLLVSCDIQEASFKAQDHVSVKILSQNETSVTFRPESKTVNDLAYLLVEISDKPEVVSAPQIFYEGFEVQAGEEVQFSFLKPRTEYCLFVAGKSGARYLEGVLEIGLNTTDTDSDFSLLETDYFGFTLDMKLPTDVKERGNVIRYKFNSLYNYNHFVKYGVIPNKYSDPYLLEWNTGLKFGDDEEGLTLEINQDTEYLKDADGNLVEDEMTGNLVQIHQPIAPGEPIVFLAGEFSKTGQSDHEDDWRTALFDWNRYDRGDESDECWTGFFDRIFISARAPEDLGDEVSIEEVSVGAVDATIKLTPGEDVEQFSVWIVEDNEYQTVHLPRLGNREEFVQWFVTSYDAVYFAGTMHFKRELDFPDNESLLLGLKQHAYDSPQPQTDYHVFVVAGNEDFTAQSMTTHTITTKAKTPGKVPEVVVTALDKAPEGEEDSPFNVWFNVKCETGDAVSGMYAANYIGPWIQEYNDTKSHSELVSMGYSWSADEIAQINSEEGYNISIGTLEGMTTRLGVILYNDEDTPNNIDAPDSKAMADAKAGYLDPAERVESELFDDLVDVWTLTGKVKYYNYMNIQWNSAESTIKTKVAISAGVEYPSVLPEEVYQVYEAKEDILGITRDEVTRQYNNFKEEAEAWNARLRGQNRLLCFGFNKGYNDQDMSRDLSAFDAFCDFDYVSYDNVSILHDFGPKWYLQIDLSGNITVPCNLLRMAPMASHYYYTMHLAAIASDDSGYTAGPNANGDLVETMSFPVEKVDNDTYVIKPLVMTPKGKTDEVTYYPTAVTLDINQTQPVLNPKYVSELTLTRGWDDGTSASPVSSVAKASPAKASAKVSSGVSSHKARTTFENRPVYRKVDYILK